jgi:DNA-binding transcriptional ArsR family regulator
VSRAFVVASPRQLRAIASPGRDDIVDAVGAIGPCTVAQIARFLGLSRESIYYHVRALRDCGLLMESLGPGDRKKSVACYDLPGRPFVVRFDLRTPASRQAVVTLGGARLRAAKRGFERACHKGSVEVDGPRRNLWASRWKGWLSKKELEAANELLWRLYGLLFARKAPNRRCYELTLVLAPVERR